MEATSTPHMQLPGSGKIFFPTTPCSGSTERNQQGRELEITSHVGAWRRPAKRVHRQAPSRFPTPDPAGSQMPSTHGGTSTVEVPSRCRDFM